MLDLINLYTHGFVVVPVILACRRKGLFELLQQQDSLTLEQIEDSLNANSGHLQVALRIMESLNWLSQNQLRQYRLTKEAEVYKKIPQDILDLYYLPMDSYLLGKEKSGFLKAWIERSRQRWNVNNPLIADFLDGILIIPILLGLKKNNLLKENEQKHLFSELNSSVREELCELFVNKQWGNIKEDSFALTDAGQFIFQRALLAGTVASYTPMLSHIDDLLFGDCQTVFSRHIVGGEKHVDRTLNVIASGFQHQKYFADVDEMILDIFNRLPFAEQPKYIADMGCGDGTLLKRVYTIIKLKSARGKVLDRYPIRMIGIDYNQASLTATAKTLVDIPHLAIQGDIGNPEQLVVDLQKHDIHDFENILHIRSFLDHDRPFISSQKLDKVKTRSHIPYQGVYVDANGHLIPPPVMIQSLVEHLDRWSSVLTKHGLIILEVHCLEPKVVYKFLEQSENLYFDACQAFSMQHLVEADVFLMAAAEVGLFPKFDFSKRYPKTFPFTRITLNCFEKQGYKIRHPHLSDLPALINLETKCWPGHLQISADEIRRRLELFPNGHCLLEIDEKIVGIIYSQKISSVNLLEIANYQNISNLHTDEGSIIQLLSLNILPEMQDRGLGDRLREFMLQWCTLKGGITGVVGVTRCKNYGNHSHMPMEAYILQRNNRGQLLDPILRFHEEGGARIEKIIPNYRPEDRDNLGTGVLIKYDIQNLITNSSNTEIKVDQRLKQSHQNYKENLNNIIYGFIRTVIGEERMKGFSWKYPLMEIGLDSLELLELRALLGEHFGIKLEPTFFFQYGTPESINNYFCHRGTVEEKNAESSFPAFTPNETEIVEDCDTNSLKINVTEEEVTRAEDIAIIGMACRFPGGANSLEEYWSLLRHGIDGIAEVPKTRWDIEQYYDSQQSQNNKISSKYGGFIDRVDQFDAQFFRISPREATCTDPQQRILLEETWKALENAGIAPESLAGTQTGIFVGIMGHDYELLQLKQNHKEEFDNYFGTGNSASIAAGRLSYFFGFNGPAIAVDTACSSSLVALHLACQSLHNSECDLALASGVNLLLSPELSIAFSQSRMLSPDGRCKTFDASANGYVRSEGCGVIVLKRLSQALVDNDNILAVVRGTAINQDGASNGLTAPNETSQEEVIKKALSIANVLPHQVSYIEAHGTATSLGDPVEITAIEAVYGQGRIPENPLTISSVKTNIGHTEAAAGIAGLIKVVLAMQNQYIPPHLHFQELNPHIHFDKIPAVIPKQGKEWEGNFQENRRLAGISSFGFSGTNAHAILEEAPSSVRSDRNNRYRFHRLLTLSAKTPKALEELVERYQNYLQTHQELELADICYTANTGRNHFSYRLAVIASNQQELAEKLLQHKAGEEFPGIIPRELTSHTNSRNKDKEIVFLFTGQGSQYVNMGRQLYQTQPVFRQAIVECDAILSRELEEPLLSVLYPNLGDKEKSTGNREEMLLDQTAYTQPALFAIEYALFKLWQSWGIKPSVVMGHSVGEYVAATVAGVFSLEDGLKLIAHRGRLMQQLPPGGQMLAVMASEELMNQLIAPYREKVAVAAINGPKSIVISGESEAIGTVKEILDSLDIKTKQLQVSHAFHSHLMEPILAEFEVVASEITYNQPNISLISNVTGARADDRITTANYWVNHVRQSVKFAQSIEILHQEGYEVFLEIGPKPILLGMARQCLPTETGVWLPSLREGQEDWLQMLQSLALLYVRGIKVDWLGFYKDYCHSKVVLPTYPFQQQRYWIENNQNSLRKQYLVASENIHPLLGEKLNFAGEQEIFASSLGEDSPAYLSMHRVFDEALFPTAAYLEIAIAAGSNRWGSGSVMVEELFIKRGLILPPGEFINLQTLLTPSDNKSYQLQIFSQQKQQNQEEQEWVLYATAKIRPHSISETKTKVELEKYLQECSKPIDVKQHYQQCSQLGIDYGISFQGIEKLWSGLNQALASIKLPEELIAQTIDYEFHPALLDAALQVIFHALPQTNSDKTYLPIGVEQFKVYSHPGQYLWAYASVADPENKQSLKANITLVSPEGEIIASIKGLEVKLANKKTLLQTEIESVTDWLYEVEWRSKGLLGRLAAPDFLLEPVEIEQELTSSITSLVAQTDDNSTSLFASSLDELSVDYIVQGFLLMGWPYKLGDTFSEDAAAQRLGVVPSQRRLFKRLLQILSEVGILGFNKQQWQLQQTLDKVDSTLKIQSLLRQFPDEAATLTLLDRCASQLYGVLRGAVDPVQLVFPEGDLSTATQLYEDSTVAKVMNTIVQKVVTQAIEKLPSTRGIRLLEIGAGTGGTTSYVLPHLNSNQAQYLFTDIGALFTTKAQEKFRSYKFLEYQTLDIELDPASQGFESHQYDMVIAANVLHATTNIKQTLSHVRQLLAPGGILVLYEATTGNRWLDLVFGLLEGWWKFQDYELRPDYPLLSRSKWEKLLADTGFTQVVTLPEIEGMPEILAQQAVIVASASQTSDAISSKPKAWLLLADEKGVAQQLAREIKSQGDVCTLVFSGNKYEQITPTEFTINPNNPSEYEKIIETLANESLALSGVVQCWSTEAGVDKTINSSGLEKLSFLGCGTTLYLLQALVKGGFSQVPRLWLVTCGSQPVPANHPVISGVAQSSLWGMGKVIRLEHSELNCVCIDLDPGQTIENQAKALFNEIWSLDKEDQVVWRGDSRYVARLVPSNHQQEKWGQLIQSESFKLGILHKGNLDSLNLESVNRHSPGTGEVEIRVKATGLNFLDVVSALGLVPQQVDGVSQKHLVEMESFGGECAGEIVALGAGVTGLNIGDSVIAMAWGSFSKYVTVDARYVTLKPENLSFEEAASIPVNFLTAYYALHHVAKITAGDKVLIHAAAGGTGMAAVQIAQAAGAEVFATASPPKWEALRKMGVKHIMNSRTLEFADQVMSLTQKQGVDVVLNSLTSGEFISKSLSAISPQGRFVEIAKRGVWDSSRVAEVRSDLSYFVVDLVQKSQKQPELINSMLHQLIDKFSDGLLKAPPLQVFPIEQVIGAFRYMQQAKHIGKIVVNQRTQQDDVNAENSLNFCEDATYLITGGTGGLGLLVADWMVSKGVKNLVLVGRSSPDETARKKLIELEMAGAAVVLEKADVSDVKAITRVLHNIENSKIPLAGIIHSAGMLSDGVLSNQTWSSFEKVMAAKVQGAWHLHQLTQNQPLDFFVLFSSVASLLGSSGQGNHSAANGFLDGLAHYRRAMGLPGLSLHWGAVSQVGEAAERGADVRAHKKGMGVISPTQVLECLELVMSSNSATKSNLADVEVGVAPIQWSVWQEKVAKWSFLSDWQEITQINSRVSGSEFLSKLEATTPKERRSLLVAHVSRQLSVVLGINNPESISLEMGFFDLGMDSLTSVEFRNKLQISLRSSLPSTLAFDYPTVGKLVDYLVSDVLSVEFCNLSDNLELQKENETESTISQELEEISESDAEVLLLEKLKNISY